MPKDYYKILGVSQNATFAEIKKAYHRLAHQYHPDKKGGDESRFKEINEAYQVLSNQEKREAYDRFGTADAFAGGAGQYGFPGGFSGGPFPGFDFNGVNFEDATNMSDFFDAFFEGLGVKQKRRNYEPGADLEVEEAITLEEAFRGMTKNLEFKAMLKCESCGGQGYDVKAGTKTCDVCNGRGELKETRKTFFGSFSQVKSCLECLGTGKKPNVVCRVCVGAGRKTGQKVISYEIFPGIRDGQIIKIVGGGEAGVRGAEAGDLYVRIKIKPHAVFERKENDLHAIKDLNIADAFLGNKIAIRGLDGKNIEVEIPRGFNLRENLRVPGEGMPYFRTHGRGDLYISWNIITAKKLSAEAKKLLEELRGELE